MASAQSVPPATRPAPPRPQVPLLPIQRFPLQLESWRPLAPGICHYVFNRGDGQPLPFLPGQFIQVHFRYADGTETKRSYSLATVHPPGGEPTGQVEIAVSFVPGGAATALFEGLEPGDTLEASGPFGRFCLMPQDANRRYVLIATGTGVTPYRSMLPLLEQAIVDRGVQVVLLQGARRPDELLYGDEFRAFANRHPDHVRYLPCFSRELPPAGSSQSHEDVRHGYVQQFIGELDPDPAADISYLCGNPNMVDAAFEALREAGLEPRQIRREKYVSSK